MANLIKFFCGKCKKLLCKGHLTNGTVEIKCKCGMVNTFAMKPETKEPESRSKAKAVK